MESAESTLQPGSISSPFAPAPRRSPARRIAPYFAALLLLAGGSYGVYLYATPPDASDADRGATERVASQPNAARDSMAQLLSSTAPNETESRASEADLPNSNDAGSKQSDRYAFSTAVAEMSQPPELPPANDSSTEGHTAEPVDVENPFASAAVDPDAANAADRYATSLDDSDVAIQSPPDPSHQIGDDQTSNKPNQPLSHADDEAEIARGQGPDDNPLRNSAQSVADDDADARYAFSADVQQAPPEGSVAMPPEPAPADSPGYDNRTAAPQQNPYLAAAPSNDPAEPPPAVDSAMEFSGQPEPMPRGPAPLSAAPTDDSDHRDAPQPAPTNSSSQPYDPTVDALDASVTPTPGISAAEGTGRPGEQILEGAQNPAIVIQKLAPPEVQVGKKCTFAIRVQNQGRRTAHNVRIVDEIPLGTTLVGTAPRATVAGSQVEWDLGSLSVGEQRIVEMELLPTQEGEIGSVATVTFAAQASAKSHCTKPELALRLTSKPSVMLGERQVIQIEIANPGSGDATGVVLLENIPEGVSHEAGPALEYPIGTLRAGETKRLELALKAEKAGQVNNIMTARADASLQVQANCVFEVIAPDLQVSVAGPKKRYLERPAKYTVNINNPGTASARDVQLVTQLPPGLEFVSANNKGEYDPATRSVYWSLAELPAGEHGSVELLTKPIESGEHRLQVASKAQQGLEDRTEQSVMVEGLAALMFEVVDLQDPIEVGGETTYEIRVVNQGSKAAANVQVAAALPRGMRALSAQSETQYEIHGEGVRFAPLQQLAPKGESTYRITVQGTVPGDQRIRVQVLADEFSPITKEASTRVYADE